MQPVITHAADETKRVKDLPMFVGVNTESIQFGVELLRSIDGNAERIVRVSGSEQSRRSIRPPGLVASTHDQSLAGGFENLLQLARVSLELAFVCEGSPVERGN